MRKFFAVALGSVVALAGFAGAANASATVDLRWIDVSVTNTMGNPICLAPANRNCPDLGTSIGGMTSTAVLASDNITLAVVLTAGPNGSIGGSVSVDYTQLINISVAGFQNLPTTQPPKYLPLELGPATVNGTVVEGINAAAAPNVGSGVGLPAGVSTYLGTVTFHKDAVVNGTFDIDPITISTDGIADLNFNDITGSSTYNSATVVNVPEPGALSLLVMGLGGMLLAGRGRRS